jgi:hypothetical protein
MLEGILDDDEAEGSSEDRLLTGVLKNINDADTMSRLADDQFESLLQEVACTEGDAADESEKFRADAKEEMHEFLDERRDRALQLQRQGSAVYYAQTASNYFHAKK